MNCADLWRAPQSNLEKPLDSRNGPEEISCAPVYLMRERRRPCPYRNYRQPDATARTQTKRRAVLRQRASPFSWVSPSAANRDASRSPPIATLGLVRHAPASIGFGKSAPSPLPPRAFRLPPATGAANAKHPNRVAPSLLGPPFGQLAVRSGPTVPCPVVGTTGTLRQSPAC